MWKRGTPSYWYDVVLVLYIEIIVFIFNEFDDNFFYLLMVVLSIDCDLVKDITSLGKLCNSQTYTFKWILVVLALLCYYWLLCNGNTLYDAVKTNELKWLPNGSELLLDSKNSDSNPSSKPRTYTSFSCSQTSLPQFANNPISPMPEITIARLGPGQVNFLFLLW